MTVGSMINPRACHALYEEAPENERNAVDEAMRKVIETFKAHGFKADATDKAEEVVGILHNYLRESK